MQMVELAGDQRPAPVARAGQLQAGPGRDDPGPPQGSLGPDPAGPQPAAQVVADRRLGQGGQLGPPARRILPVMDRPWSFWREAAEEEPEGVGADRVLLGHPRQDVDVAVGGCRTSSPPWPLPASHPTTIGGRGTSHHHGCPPGGPPRSWWGADQARPRQRAAWIEWPATALASPQTPASRARVLRATGRGRSPPPAETAL